MKQFILSITALLFFADIASGTVLGSIDPDIMSKVNGITLPFVKNEGQLDDPSTLFYSNKQGDHESELGAILASISKPDKSRFPIRSVPHRPPRFDI